MEYKLKDLKSELPILIQLYSNHSDIKFRWDNRYYIKMLLDTMEGFNEELNNLKAEADNKDKLLRRKYNIKNKVDENTPLEYYDELQEIDKNLKIDINKLLDQKIQIPKDMPKIKLSEVESISKKIDIDIKPINLYRIEKFIKDDSKSKKSNSSK